MKQLTCEICGGTDLCKQEGVFVCQSCGTKYSVEEARKMMVDETADATRETAAADETVKVENYLRMASEAIDSGNDTESENYCNQALEIDPKNYFAWLFKAKAVVRQAPTDRSAEVVKCLMSGLKYAPEEQKCSVVQITCEMMMELCVVLITTYCDNLANSLNEGEEKAAILLKKMLGVITIAQEYIDAVNPYSSSLLTEDKKKIRKDMVVALLYLKNIGDEIANIVIKCVVIDAWNEVWEDYQGY
jgi:uncharacterized Zn finger protein (UPF0148 family)